MKTEIPKGDLYRYLCWERRRPVYTNFYLEPEERRELIQEAGVHGLVLFEYYLFMANQKDGNEEISDERAADWFGWTVRTARRHRQALLTHGWLLVEKAKGPTYINYTYFLGKAAVADRRAAVQGG